MNYRIKIKASNKMFIIKDKPVRSPFECIVADNYLPLIQSRIKFYGLQNKDYEIEIIDHNSSDINNDQKKVYDYIPSEKVHDKKEKTIKRVSNIKPTNKIKNTIVTEQEIKPLQKKYIKREKKIVHQKQESDDLPSSQKKEILEIKMKVFNDPSEKLEQNINTKDSNIIDELNNNSIVNSSDVEVKIEELTCKSSSILEKFLNSEL